MADLAEVHTLYEVNASDIPAMLRQAADSIETEREEGYSPTTAMVAVQHCENGGVKVYGWGALDSLQALAILQLGIDEMLHQSRERRG